MSTCMENSWQTDGQIQYVQNGEPPAEVLGDESSAFGITAAVRVKNGAHVGIMGSARIADRSAAFKQRE